MNPIRAIGDAARILAGLAAAATVLPAAVVPLGPGRAVARRSQPRLMVPPGRSMRRSS
jgi:hypothetical protein